MITPFKNREFFNQIRRDYATDGNVIILLNIAEGLHTELVVLKQQIKNERLKNLKDNSKKSQLKITELCYKCTQEPVKVQGLCADCYAELKL